ncbi:MAG: hypothetical protein ABI855_12745 [Bacteroidota bacterium]
MEKNKQYEQAAAEYLIAFIKHLYNQGKSGFEIAETLEIHSDLIEKLISDQEMLETMKQRNDTFIESLKAQYPDDAKFIEELRYPRGFYFSTHDNRYHDYSDRLKNIGPWQRRFGFANAIDFYFNRKKKYSENDNDVLTRLSTGADVREAPDNFSERDLSPDYKLRVINDLSDGHPVIYISERYNCSEVAVNETAAAHNLTLPVSTTVVRERLIQAIKDGYNFEQLRKRFRNEEQEIKELIAIYRLSRNVSNPVH